MKVQVQVQVQVLVMVLVLGVRSTAATGPRAWDPTERRPPKCGEASHLLRLYHFESEGRRGR